MILDQTSPDRVLLADQLFARLRDGQTLRESAAALSLSRGAARRMVKAYQLRSTVVHAEIDETIVAAPVAPTLPVSPRALPVPPEFTSREEIVVWFGAQIQAARFCEISELAAARDAALAAWDGAHLVEVRRAIRIVRERAPRGEYVCDECGAHVRPGTVCWETGQRH